jgi:hypothetical protein
MKTYDNLHDAYLGTIEDVLDNPDYEVAPRGQPILEKTDYCFRVLNPTCDPIVTKDLERNKIIESYTTKECELYDSGSNKVDDFAKASSFWKKIANPDGTVNSAYGYLIWFNRSHGNPTMEAWHLTPEEMMADPGIYERSLRTPWDWAKQCLVDDQNTRQAIMRFSLPEHAWRGVKDFTCTMHGNWQIRNNKLNLSITMRSNDLALGLVYDISWFISLMYKMQDELKNVYPGLTIGHYTHIAHSMHIYKRDLERMHRMIGRDENK